MKLFELFLIENKISHLVKTMGHKVMAAYNNDTYAQRFLPNSEEVTAEEIIGYLANVDPQGQKHLQWIVKLYANGDFKLEDLERVETALIQFTEKKRGLEKKDIGQYKKLSELEQAVEDQEEVKSNRQKKQEIKADGAKVLFKSAKYLIIDLYTEAAAKFYGKNTKWCTASDKNNMFNTYIDYSPLYVIVDRSSNRKYQYQWDHEDPQFMDENDDDVDIDKLIRKYPAITTTISPRSSIDHVNMALVLAKRTPEADKEVLAHYEDYPDDRLLESYLLIVVEDPWPEAAAAILSKGEAADAGVALAYAYVLGKKWPEAESAIAYNSQTSLNYARDILHGRFPEGEEIIAQSDYAKSEYNDLFGTNL